MSERAEFVATLDASQIKGEIADIREKTEVEGNAIGEKLEGAFERAHGSARHLAGGINALASSFGDANSEIGKMVQEAGHVAGLAEIFGPWGAAVAALGFAAGQVAENFGGVDEEAKKAAEESEKHFDDLKKELQDLDDQLTAMASGQKIEIVKQKAIVAAAEVSARQSIDEIGGAAAFARLAQYEEEGIEIPKRIADQYEETKKVVAEYGREQTKLFDQIRNEQNEQVLKNEEEEKKTGQKRVDDETKVAEEIKKRHAELQETLGKQALERANQETETSADLLKDYEDAGTKRLQQEAKDEAAHMELVRKDAEEQKKIIDELDRLQQENTEKYQAIVAAGWKQVYDGVGHDAEALAESGASAIENFVDASISGNKKAAQEAAAAFAKQVGSQLVGMGVRDSFAAAGMLLSGLPSGPAMAALAAAELGVGLAMGGVGAAITPPSGGSGSTSTSAAATHPGVNTAARSSSAAQSSSGPATINLYFGAAGTAPEQAGKAVSDALDYHLRRTGIAAAKVQGPRW